MADPLLNSPRLRSASTCRSRTPLAGTGELAFERCGGRTVLTRALARAPLKWLATHPKSPAVWVMATGLGGGLVGGDRVRVKADLGPDALALVTTQASTKVYRSSLPAGQSLQARLAAGARLAWLPDPVVCFEGSRYEQSQEFHLEEGAGLVLADALASGRRARGESWKFGGYASTTRLWSGGRLAFFDALRLDPAEGALEQRFGRFHLLYALLVFGAPFRDDARALRESVRPPSRGGRVLEYAAEVAGQGVIWRLAAQDGAEAEDRVRRRLGFLARLLGDDPWRRKLLEFPEGPTGPLQGETKETACT